MVKMTIVVNGIAYEVKHEEHGDTEDLANGIAEYLTQDSTMRAELVDGRQLVLGEFAIKSAAFILEEAGGNPDDDIF